MCAISGSNDLGVIFVTGIKLILVWLYKLLPLCPHFPICLSFHIFVCVRYLIQLSVYVISSNLFNFFIFLPCHVIQAINLFNFSSYSLVTLSHIFTFSHYSIYMYLLLPVCLVVHTVPMLSHVLTCLHHSINLSGHASHQFSCSNCSIYIYLSCYPIYSMDQNVHHPYQSGLFFPSIQSLALFRLSCHVSHLFCCSHNSIYLSGRVSDLLSCSKFIRLVTSPHIFFYSNCSIFICLATLSHSFSFSHCSIHSAAWSHTPSA